jgi:spectinomycin phosphotransferase/16S rRNA (guanine(1405)-N(7))-methyltransferase
VLTQPDDLPDAVVAAAVASGWHVTLASVVYLPVGFGSHHWRADGAGGPWFVTVDDLDVRRRSADEPRERAFGRLTSALATARGLADSGLSFVLAPAADRTGAVLERLSDRYAIAVYPFLVGRSSAWGETLPEDERRILLAQIVALHGSSTGTAATEDFVVPHRDALDAALGDLGRPWAAGPYAEATRLALATDAEAARATLLDYDRLAALPIAGPERFVLTHGEPHASNVLRTAAGQFLIDWDTCLLAPPERDLRILAEDDTDAIHVYTAATGRTVEPNLLDLYRLAWDLGEVAIYVDLFRQPHTDGADTRKSWSGLTTSLAALRGWNGTGVAPAVSRDG